jgi:hypothetical protein
MKTINNILILGILSILFGCGEASNKSKPYNENRELVPNPEGYKKDTFILSGKDTTLNIDCRYGNYLNDLQTPKLAKEIFNDNDWNLDNDIVLSFLDSLTAKDKNARPFYFRVVTNSEKKSDGYYSEVLGLAGKEYAESHTREFLGYFDNKYCFTDKDLQTWADIILLEFGLVDDSEYSKSVIDKYIIKLRLNCKDCSSSQKETLTKFSMLLKAKWKDYLKNIDK